MGKLMYDVEEVREKINNGETLLIAGDEDILKQLPQGKWIGGTIPYFMAEEGGLSTKSRIYITKLPDYINHISIKTYDKQDIKSIFMDEPNKSVSFIIIPASSEIHLSFALKAPTFEGFATRPLIGWISGIHLDDLGKITAKVFNGENREMLENKAVVMHAELPEDMYPEVKILNIFEQGEGDVIKFPEDGFNAKQVHVNGENINFAEYITKKGLDIKLPLVANYSGAMINTSFQAVDEEDGRVDFYAPVFKGVEYKQAKPIDDYISKFLSQMPEEGIENIVFSCNCILNYLYAELEGKQTGEFTGPMTFGEIAFQLLNQTMAYLRIMKF